ncbi:MAG TPA: tetratricopeptide repeat protein [Burkholderiales bacterium]|nr:tetratricopeptide repeat protein [Burkholderiales bacterium]
MHRYGVREVEKLLRLPRSTIRALIDAGFVSPARGPRNAWRFSFQDLIVLRTAQALADAKVAPKRITRSMKELRRQLPEAMPLSGLSIGAVGDRVVVRQGARRWQAESGQYLLAFEGDPAAGALSIMERKTDWYEKALSLEDKDPQAALDAYRQALAANPKLLDAHLNRGWLLHEAGRLEEAERAYREGLAACGDDALLLYNLGVLLVELERKEEAAAVYEAALRARPGFADCHYNLALLCEELERPREAIRHMARYRRLTGGRPD